MKNDNITFDDVKYKPREVSGLENNAPIVKPLMRCGIVKTEKQANAFLLLLTFLFLVLAAYVCYRYVFDGAVGVQEATTTLSPEEIQANREMRDKGKIYNMNQSNTQNN